MLLTFAQYCLETHKDAPDQLLELIVMPECVIERAPGSCGKLGSRLVSPNPSTPVLLQYVWEVNLLEVNYTAVSFSKGKQKFPECLQAIPIQIGK